MPTDESLEQKRMAAIEKAMQAMPDESTTIESYGAPAPDWVAKLKAQRSSEPLPDSVSEVDKSRDRSIDSAWAKLREKPPFKPPTTREIIETLDPTGISGLPYIPPAFEEFRKDPGPWTLSSLGAAASTIAPMPGGLKKLGGALGDTAIRGLRRLFLWAAKVGPKSGIGTQQALLTAQKLSPKSGGLSLPPGKGGELALIKYEPVEAGLSVPDKGFQGWPEPTELGVDPRIRDPRRINLGRKVIFEKPDWMRVDYPRGKRVPWGQRMGWDQNPKKKWHEQPHPGAQTLEQLQFIQGRPLGKGPGQIISYPWTSRKVTLSDGRRVTTTMDGDRNAGAGLARVLGSDKSARVSSTYDKLPHNGQSMIWQSFVKGKNLLEDLRYIPDEDIPKILTQLDELGTALQEGQFVHGDIRLTKFIWDDGLDNLHLVGAKGIERNKNNYPAEILQEGLQEQMTDIESMKKQFQLLHSRR